MLLPCVYARARYPYVTSGSIVMTHGSSLEQYWWPGLLLGMMLEAICKIASIIVALLQIFAHSREFQLLDH